jgi:hypothetical protein
VAVVGLLAALPAAAEARYSLRYFYLSPSCVAPGGAVTARVGIRQDEVKLQPLYSRLVVRQAQTGLVVKQRDEGPVYFPYGNWEIRRTETIPSNAPYGDYTVTLLLGSTRGGSDWGSAARPLTVRPALLC